MLAALVALVSVACGDDAEEEAAAPAAAPAPAAAAPAAAAPAPAAAPPAAPQEASDVTITMAIREVSEQFGDFEVQTYGGSPGELQMGYYDQLLVHDGTDPLSPFAAKSWSLNSAGDTLSMEIRDDLKCNTPQDLSLIHI